MSFEGQTHTVIELVGAGVLWVEDGNHGANRPLADEFEAVGTPFIRPDDLKHGVVQFNGCDRINETALKRVRKGKGRAGDIVFTHRATVGRIARVPSDSPDFVANPGVTVYRSTQPEVLDPNYLYYFMQGSFFMDQVWAEAGNTDTFPYISLTQQRRLKLLLPSIELQRSIGAVLGSLDDRMILLRETNTTLEAIAQALFKSWFVDFDPVHAKMQGRTPEGMDEATAALFPDGFEESELGPAPKGWRVQKFGDFIDRQSVGKKFDQKTALATGQVPILDQGKSGVIGFHNEEPGIKASLEKPVVVFANHTCYMRLICFDFSAIQNVLPFVGKGVDTVWAFYATKDRIKFSEYKGHWPDFAIEKAVVPPVEFTDVFRCVVDPLTARIRNNELQIQNLAALRDTLLPRLISGQLQIESMEARDGS
jgi:type I restriction enzyme, S subunit